MKGKTFTLTKRLGEAIHFKRPGKAGTSHYTKHQNGINCQSSCHNPADYKSD